MYQTGSFRVWAALLATGACLALGSGGLGAESEAKVVPITAKRFEFSPKEITLKRGETVKL